MPSIPRTPRPRRNRVVTRLLYPFGSPTDSGYGSSECPSPQRTSYNEDAPSIPPCCLNYDFVCDGSGSSDKQESDHEFEIENIPARSDPSRPRPVPEIPSSFHSKRATPRHHLKSTRHNTQGTLRLPDRFVPRLKSPSSISIRYRTSKSVTDLTTSERLLRHRDATSDPFLRRSRSVVPLASDFRYVSRVEEAPSTTIPPLPENQRIFATRQLSHGTIWAIGGAAPSGTAINGGHGQLIRTGTNARFHYNGFLGLTNPGYPKEVEQLEARLAYALDIDQASKVLRFDDKLSKDPQKFMKNSLRQLTDKAKTKWNGTEWVIPDQVGSARTRLHRKLPTAPFRVLDAPDLRDDYYCSILAYSATWNALMVGLGGTLYSWSSRHGVMPVVRGPDSPWVTSVSFSSDEGKKGILAYSRSSGYFALTSLDSHHPTNPSRRVYTEDLLVGDVLGHVYYYVVEWPEAWEVARDNWPGSITLVAKISAHALQICALVWSPNGQVFATGANDNYCCLFEVDKILRPQRLQGSVSPTVRRRTGSSEDDGTELYDMLIQNAGDDEETHQLLNDGTSIRTVRTSPDKVPQFGSGAETRRWTHSAAVKAVAFCPWQDGLVATGGGSNDRCIHFFHTKSGTALATIACAAQVTSLIWSTNRREIVATFGYTQPEHLFRIAVFSWPSYEQVGVVKWDKGHRALCAIPYPGGPKGLCRYRSRERPAEEGGIVVASSDNTIKFHEVWQTEKRVTVGGKGMLGGSDILEGLEGIYKEGDIIR